MARAKKELMEKKREKAEKSGKQTFVSDYACLLEPVITEKTSLVNAEGNSVVFRVDRRATKNDIRGAVERIYGVNVEAVRTCNYTGKLKRAKRSEGRRANYKKAFVQIKTGQTIDVVEGL